MKNCACGFSYRDTKDLEMINLIATKGVIKYYCPCCKQYKFTEKYSEQK